ncbi:hypothetical protein ASU33_20025 [Solirubrum puertoriconensis]|uniref:Uncharacterized protein n=1 Tax=Solirubrum puertoriconensis TaxID=1751427 RepID=A0A9X0L5Y7_SOLP1|nr:hypothetical protein ASU33_20025 [Solirubrum puertoriconensis]
MALWCVHSKGINLRLWRTGSYKFRVVEASNREPGDLLTNYDYILFPRKYEGALRTTGAQLQLTPVTVTDEVRKLVWHHYLEATIKHDITSEEISRGSQVGPAIFRYGDQDPSVFVSDALRATLQQVQGQSLLFSAGLSLFGG